MLANVAAGAVRVRVITTRLLERLGMREDAFLVVLAVLIGLVTAAAAVSFHELISVIRRYLYAELGARLDLYHRGIAFLVLIPAAGGLAVGVIGTYILRVREGKGIVDVLEQVTRSSGMISPIVALERIVTSAITIGSGGSAGAEGPIIQIGAGVASGFGQLFRIARQHMPVLIGCGSAAGISAIFNAPIGGVLFTLEVVLRDFSIRTFTPVVIASVIANFAAQSILRSGFGEEYNAIFSMPPNVAMGFALSQLWSFALLGLICGVVGVCLTRLMHFTEHVFARLKAPRALKPAIGGALLGFLGIAYILLIGKVVDPTDYAMPAFFGDGYGAIQTFLEPDIYSAEPFTRLLSILVFFLAVKILATCLTLGSGGAGGVIAPTLFLGAMTGGALGLLLKVAGLSTLDPHVYALVGLGAVLAAVVHAPLAAILILFEVTHDYQITLPAMLSTIIATGTARSIFRDSIYTLSLRERGVRLGTSSDVKLLQRLSVEQVGLEPASTVRLGDPFQHILDLASDTGVSDFIVVDKLGLFAGIITSDDINAALLQREAVPLLLVDEVMRTDCPLVRTTDDLATVMDLFSLHDLPRLPVSLDTTSSKIIGLISRQSLLKRYQRALAEG